MRYSVFKLIFKLGRHLQHPPVYIIDKKQLQSECRVHRHLGRRVS
jgi:hypothetical protein